MTNQTKKQKLLEFKRPQPDMELYNKVKNQGFLNYPERKENYQKYLNSEKYKCFIDFMPIKLDIEIAARCNLRCRLCDVSTWKGGVRDNIEDMTLKDFQEILEAQYGVIELRIQGLGEPSLNKHFQEMIAYARSRDLWVRTTTNATLLHKQDRYKRIVDADICEIMVSIDGATRETFENVRINSSFHQVSENCKLLNHYLQQKGIVRSKMWVTIHNHNFHELFMFPKVAKELGFDRLGINIGITHWGKETWMDKYDSNSPEIMQDDIYKLVDIADKINIELGIENINVKYSKENLCSWPFERAFISTDKQLVPCCMVANPESASFGTLGDFTILWNSEKYKEFRKAHISGKLPVYCRNCYN